MGFGVWGLGFGVWGLGFGVWGVLFLVISVVQVCINLHVHSNLLAFEAETYSNVQKCIVTCVLFAVIY